MMQKSDTNHLALAAQPQERQTELNVQKHNFQRGKVKSQQIKLQLQANPHKRKRSGSGKEVSTDYPKLLQSLDF
jgi:hypothetical protein